LSGHAPQSSTLPTAPHPELLGKFTFFLSCIPICNSKYFYIGLLS